MTNTTDPSTPDIAAEAAVPRGYWANARGELIPEKRVKPVDRDRDATVRRIATAAIAQRDALLAFKAAAFREVAEFVIRSSTQYEGAKAPRGAAGKGNVQLLTYDGKFKVILAVQDSIAFDERLQVAKALIDDRLQEWSKNSSLNIKAVIAHTFQVDQAGRVNTGRILALRQIDIDDPVWHEAQRAIADSLSVVSSKSYIRIYERDARGAYQPVSLDLAAV